MDGKRGEVDFAVILVICFRIVGYYFSLVIDQDEVGDASLVEMHPKGIDAEMIKPLRISGGDMAGAAFVKAITREKTERRREALLAVTALFGKRSKDRRARYAIEQRPWL